MRHSGILPLVFVEDLMALLAGTRWLDFMSWLVLQFALAKIQYE